tara:strand:- start:621 stop:905 length:285 start_codon:yes stop_codon:yes gene_type:complete
MELLNDLFSKCNIDEKKSQEKIEANLKYIITSYVNSNTVDFSCIRKSDRLNTEREQQFLLENGANIITTELTNKGEYVDINDVETIIDYYLSIN